MGKLSVNLCGIELDNPVIPASGTFGYGYEFAELYDINMLADYQWVSRIKPGYIKPIEKTFNMWPENSDVGTVMCDRGTDSIYGIHTEYVELSVTDDDATEVILYKNGTQIAVVSLDDAETVNGLRVVNVAENLDGEGLYTVKTDQSNDVQETFYIKSDIDGIIDYLSEANHDILVGFTLVQFFQRFFEVFTLFFQLRIINLAAKCIQSTKNIIDGIPSFLRYDCCGAALAFGFRLGIHIDHGAEVNIGAIGITGHGWFNSIQ